MGKSEMPQFLDASDALGDAWASIDDKLTEYRRGRKSENRLAYGGHCAGYQADAEEMIERLRQRGFVVRRLSRRS